MTDTIPEPGKMLHVLFAGKVAIAIVPIGTEWRAFSSGNAAHAAMAANYGLGPEGRLEHGYNPVKISVATTLGAGTNNEINTKLLNMFGGAGVEVFSHADARLIGHLYLPGASSLREEVISRRIEPSDLSFAPLKIPGVQDVTPDVVVIGGSFVTDPRTAPDMLDFGRHFRAKGSLIMVDLSHAPDAAMTKDTISIAHVVKMSRPLLLSHWGDKNDPENEIKAVKKLLKLGKRIAVITSDERVEANMYWKIFQKPKIPGMEKVKVLRKGKWVEETRFTDHARWSTPIRRYYVHPPGAFRHSVNADEMLTGALARALAENNVTPQSLRSGPADQGNMPADPATVAERAVEIQGRAIRDLDKHPKDREPLIAGRRTHILRLLRGKLDL